MRLIVLAAVVMMADGCRIYRRIPENGTAYATRYHIVFRTELDVEDQYVGGKLVKTVAYHKNGVKAIETTTDEKFPGRVRTEYFYPNGRRMRETLIVDDTLVVEHDWYDDGMQRLNFVLGADRRQRVQRWYINGIRSEESEWRGNERDGKYIQWDSTGRRIRNERYRNGMKIGRYAP